MSGKQIEYSNIWFGRTKYFDVIVETFDNHGLNTKVDRKNFLIEVDTTQYDEAYGMLMELNSELGAGW